MKDVRYLWRVASVALITLGLIVFTGCAERASHAGKTEVKKAGVAPPVSAPTADPKPSAMVLVMGLSQVGSISGLGSVAVEVRETRSASDNMIYASGVLITVKEHAASGGRSQSSFINYADIEPLIRGLEGIGKFDKNTTSFDNFQSHFDLGDLSLGTFSTPKGDVDVVVSSGASLKTSAYFKLPDLPKLGALMADAKSKLDAAKATKK